MSLSTALKLADIDDFITPAQECVKPVKINKSDGKTKTIRIEEDGGYTGITEDGKEYAMQKAEITLNDCLACSGCVTTAESVLIAEQSQDEFFRFLTQNKESTNRKFVAVSVSPQSRASLAAKFNLSALEVSKRLTGFLKGVGVDLVLDITFAREFSLYQSAMEFCDRYKGATESKTALPMLASACPGWVCYAEKTQGGYVLPYISVTKSPQQIMGYLVKRYLPFHASELSSDLACAMAACSGGVYHVTVMPCFDKKLEASRDEFSVEIGSVEGEESIRDRDVDLVLSSLEMETWIGDILTHQSHELDNIFACVLEKDSEETIYSHLGSGSGGYLDFVLRFAANKLFNLNMTAEDKLEYKVLRNQDIQEVVLNDPTVSDNEAGGPPKELLRFAFAYGFRNIQTIVQQIKRKKCKFHFVEIMACPGGCLNGGGQIREPLDDSEASLSDLQVAKSSFLSRVQEAYFSLPSSPPFTNPLVTRIYTQLITQDPQLVALSTTYREVPKIEIVNPAALKW